MKKKESKIFPFSLPVKLFKELQKEALACGLSIAGYIRTILIARKKE